MRGKGIVTTTLEVLLAMLVGKGVAQADIDSQEVYYTGNSHPSLSVDGITNLLQHASRVPQEMEHGSNAAHRALIPYSLSNIPVASSNELSFLVCDDDGNLYGVGGVDTNGQGSVSLYRDKPALNNPSVILATNTPLHAAVGSERYVHGLEAPLDYVFIPPFGKFFNYTNDTLGKVIGSIDSDGDTHHDYAEERLGTNPDSSNSVFRITGVAGASNLLAVTWNAKSNVTYHVEGKSNLLNTGWIPIDTVNPTNDGQYTWFVPIVPGDKFFYRIAPDITEP